MNVITHRVIPALIGLPIGIWFGSLPEPIPLLFIGCGMILMMVMINAGWHKDH